MKKTDFKRFEWRYMSIRRELEQLLERMKDLPVYGLEWLELSKRVGEIQVEIIELNIEWNDYLRNRQSDGQANSTNLIDPFKEV